MMQHRVKYDFELHSGGRKTFEPAKKIPPTSPQKGNFMPLDWKQVSHHFFLKAPKPLLLNYLDFGLMPAIRLIREVDMKFITTPFVFLVAALVLIGVAHGDLWIAFSRFSSLGSEAKASCLLAAFAGFFAALLRD